MNTGSGQAPPHSQGFLVLMECQDWNWDRDDPSVIFNRQYHYRALASPGACMGGQEERGVLGRTMKKRGTRRESRTGGSISQGGNSKSIIRLANDL